METNGNEGPVDDELGGVTLGEIEALINDPVARAKWVEEARASGRSAQADAILALHEKNEPELKDALRMVRAALVEREHEQVLLKMKEVMNGFQQALDGNNPQAVADLSKEALTLLLRSFELRGESATKIAEARGALEKLGPSEIVAAMIKLGSHQKDE